jgi:hypothetical protein
VSTRRKRKARKSRAVEEAKPPTSHRLDALRQRLFGAMGVASCVEYASDSMLAPREGKPDIQNTMAHLFAHLDEVAGELGVIVDELGGPPELSQES